MLQVKRKMKERTSLDDMNKQTEQKMTKTLMDFFTSLAEVVFCIAIAYATHFSPIKTFSWRGGGGGRAPGLSNFRKVLRSFNTVSLIVSLALLFRKRPRRLFADKKCKELKYLLFNKFALIVRKYSRRQVSVVYRNWKPIRFTSFTVSLCWCHFETSSGMQFQYLWHLLMQFAVSSNGRVVFA